MSADNCIAILKTMDKFKVCYEQRDGVVSWLRRVRVLENQFDERITAFRVAHAGAIDNFDYYCDKEPHNLGFYLHGTWGQSPVFYVYSEAMKYARKILKEVSYTEYGIVSVDASKFNFPGH